MSTSRESERHYVQADQPDGVPPLELTGERTLPDVPEENYWFRRHLAVYEWIAGQVGGLRVADLPELRDVDTAADALTVAQEAPQSRFAARTRELAAVLSQADYILEETA